MEVSLTQALAWRGEQQFLTTGAGSAADVVRRLVAVPAWSGDPTLAVRRRLTHPSPSALGDAVHDGHVIKTFAFRGATHLLAAEDAAAYMAVRSANRQWELPSWCAHYALAPDDWPALREVVRAAVAHGPIPQSELAERVAKTPRFQHLQAALADRSHTLLKPLAWQGELCFGPDEHGKPTFQSPSANPRWTGLPDLDDAGRRAVLAYLAAYGPATRGHLHYWLNEGLSAGRRRLDGWIAELADDRVVEVIVDGCPMLHRREDVASLAAADPTPEHVVLLPGYDQWVLGPGTDDSRIVADTRRRVITRGANVALRAGKVAGTWKLERETLSMSWFAEMGRPPQAALETESERLAVLLDRHLTLTMTLS